MPEGERSLARAFSDAHARYTRMVNLREGWRGHLWQGRFGASPMDEGYTVATLRYVERNPVRAGLVELPWRYRWSSAARHVGAAEGDPIVTDEDDGWFGELAPGGRAFLAEPDEEAFLGLVRRESVSGRPLGTGGFVRGLEKRLGRALARARMGRPSRAEREG